MSTPKNGFDSDVIKQLYRERQKLDDVIAAYESFREKLAELPQEIASRIQLPKKQTTRVKRREKRPARTDKTEDKPQTHFEQIAEYLRLGKNEPKTAREIRDATGIARGNISLLLYKARKDDFVKLADDTGVIRWKLKDYSRSEGTSKS
jgi:hypothetical protein